MAQAVSRWSLTVESRVRSRISGFVVDKMVLDRFFPPSSLVLTCQYHPTVALHTHISRSGRSSETRPHPIYMDMNNISRADEFLIFLHNASVILQMDHDEA
jgi:hypothetical protein